MRARDFVRGCVILLLLALPSCYGTREETRQLDAISYLVFTGDFRDCTAFLHQDGKPVWPGTRITASTRYSVKPGTYELSVERRGRVVVRRRVYLEDQQTFEVRVP